MLKYKALKLFNKKKNKKIKILVFTGATSTGTDGGAAILKQYLHGKSLAPTYLVLSKNKKNGFLCKYKIKIFELVCSFLKTFSLQNFFKKSYWTTLILNSSCLVIPKTINPQEYKYYYTWGGDKIWVDKVIELTQLYKIPVLLHLMDNHFEPHQQRLQRFELERIRLNKKLVISAFKIFVISKKMQKLIYRVFKRPSKLAPVFPENIKTYSGKKSVNKAFNIGWFGSLDQAQKTGISKFIEGCAELPIPVKLTAFDASKNNKKILPLCVNVKKHPRMESSKSIKTTLKNLNALLLAYDFSKYTKIHYKFSSPAKLNFYLRAKLPIIAFGPKSINPIEIFCKNKCGLVISSQKSRDIQKAMLKILKKPNAFLRQAAKYKILKSHFPKACLDV